MKRICLAFILSLAFLPRGWGQSLVPVGAGIPSGYGIYNGTVAFNGELYACDHDHIYKYDGSTWTDIGITIDYAIICMEVYAGELYVGGWFTSFNGMPLNRIARYDGVSWQAAGTGIEVGPGITGGVEKMTVYNGELIALGSFIQAGGVPVNKIAKWNGASWSALGNGFPGSQLASIPAMSVFNSDLYVFSQLDTAGTVPVHNAAKWDGTNWSAVGSGINNWPVSSTVHDNNIYVGLWVTDTSSMIVRWNGVSWSPVEPSSSNTSWNVAFDLKSYNGCLYATGMIDTIGGTAVNNVARYDGVDWHPVGSGVNGSGQFFTELDTALYLTGDFMMSGTVTVNNVVRLVSPPLCAAVSVNEASVPDDRLIIFPNPSDGKFQLKWNGLNTAARIEIINLLGKRICERPVDPDTGSVDLRDLTEGIYFLRCYDSAGNLITKKIIKQ
jgi:hypothetical protein